MMKNKVIISIPEGKLRDYIDGTIRNDTPKERKRRKERAKKSWQLKKAYEN